MKLLIASDLHGSLPATQAVVDCFEREQCDLLCLLGDILNYGPRNGLPTGLDPQGVAALLNSHAQHIIAVRGNCDSEVDQMLLHFPIMADYALVVDATKRLFLTHGHIYNEQNLPPLEGIDAFFYGHTHLRVLQPSEEGRPLICNTGSPTFPKGGNPPTFAIWDNGVVRHVVVGE